MPLLAPKLFISYCWTSTAHEEWVLSFATELRQAGIYVILDKWDLKEGHDAHAFMEKMVSDPDINKVVLVCDRMYAEKADGRSGGVGTETQILSSEVYAKQDQNKFVAVLAERSDDGAPYLPTYYRSRVYVDLSSPDHYTKNFEQVLRWVYDKPLHVKPDLGGRPAFLEEASVPSLQTTVLFRRALKAVREGSAYADGALREYFDAFAKNLEIFRVVSTDAQFDDLIVRSIEDFLPYRNEAIEILGAVARYRPTDESWSLVHKFFEDLLPYGARPDHITTYRDWDFDNLKFIIHEIALYAIATFLANEQFAAIRHLLEQRYYFAQNASYDKDTMVPLSAMRAHLGSLDHRNKRLKLNRLSLHADLLEERVRHSGFTFQQIMQADLVVFLGDCMDVVRGDRTQQWWPVTLVYASRQHGPFEIFARAQSGRYFDRIKMMFGVERREDFGPLELAFRDDRLRAPGTAFGMVNIFALMGLSKLATTP